MVEEKICFIISRIGKNDSPERIDADRKLKYVFTPALEKAGYDAIRADEEDSPGSISKKIVLRLINSKLVIADITGNNPNVFYELAIRNAVGKPVIIVKDPEQKPPFDIQDIRCVSIDMTNPEIWQEGLSLIEKLIKKTEEDPIQASGSILSDFLKSFKLDNEKEISIEERSILEIQDLKSEIKELRDDLHNKTKPTIRRIAPKRTAHTVLQLINKYDQGQNIKQIAGDAGLSMSTLMVDLRDLEHAGLIEIDPNKTMKIFKTTKLGKTVSKSMDL